MSIEESMQKINLSLLGAGIFLFIAPLSSASIYFDKTEYIILPLSLIMLFIGRIMISSRVILSDFFCKVSLAFYLPMFISAIWAFIILLLWNTDPSYYKYITGDYFSRIIHILLLYAIFAGIMPTLLLKDTTRYTMTLKIYAYGIFIILGIMGLWQVLHNLTGIWCPELETRNNLYFARDAGVNRVTSFADEPSYLAPFVIDAILIFAFIKKPIYAVLLIIVLLFSLSFGGYMELIILLLSFLFLSKTRVKLRMIIGLICGGIMLTIFFPNAVEFLQLMSESRTELQSGFSVGDTSRTYCCIQILREWLNQDIISMLIGAGPSSLKYLYESHPYVLFVTTNNIYFDFLYEVGIIGVMCYCGLIYFFWKKFAKQNDVEKAIIPKLFIIHILLSSSYTAGYASPRYVCLFIVIFCFNNILNPKISDACSLSIARK